MYKHTQNAHALMALLVAAVVLPVGLVVLRADAEVVVGRVIGVVVLLVVFACAVMFGRMTIAVEGGQLVWHFAFGLLRKAIPLADINGAEPTRTSVLDGWGIHLTPRGWLYNVTGREAVWVKVRSGRDFLLGTDRPSDLAQAIEKARAMMKALTTVLLCALTIVGCNAPRERAAAASAPDRVSKEEMTSYLGWAIDLREQSNQAREEARRKVDEKDTAGYRAVFERRRKEREAILAREPFRGTPKGQAIGGVLNILYASDTYSRNEQELEKARARFGGPLVDSILQHEPLIREKLAPPGK